MNAIVRPYRCDDDVEFITTLLHRAYAPLAAAGMRYTATWQSSEVTLTRLTRGHPLIAECDGRLVGTVTVYPPDENSVVPLYRDPRACHFGQFAVDTDWQRRGIGSALHQAAVGHALSRGADFMGLDTAVPATGLIALYQNWGYGIVERIRFKTTNYESVIMRRDLRGGGGSGSSA